MELILNILKKLWKPIAGILLEVAARFIANLVGAAINAASEIVARIRSKVLEAEEELRMLAYGQ